MDVDKVEPLPWSWLHWWEANRDEFLVPLVQTRKTQEREDDAFSEVRAKAVAALMRALGDPGEPVRPAAALALGLLGEPSAVDRLVEVAAADPSETARVHALLALGMIGDERAQDALLDSDYPNDVLLVAAIVALSRTDNLTPKAVTGLQQFLAGRAPIGNAAIWTIGVRGGDSALAGRALTSPSPWMASDAMLALSGDVNRRTLGLLADVAVGGAGAQQLPAWRFVDEIRQVKGRLITESRMEGGRPQQALLLDWLEANRRLFQMAPVARQAANLPRGGEMPRMVEGIEDIYLGRLRVAAAIALGRHGGDGATRALLAVVNARENDADRLAKCFALIGLGRIGSPEALPTLLSIVVAEDARRHQQSRYIESPLRGFAAIALGLYARPVETAQGSSDRPGYDRAVSVLLERLGDRRDAPEVRNACAVALGISRRTAVLKPLVNFSGNLTSNDLPLVGHVLLARAMLSDRNLLGPVGNLLSLPRHRDEMTDLLARRAAVLALGIQGTRDVVPFLVRAWDEPYYVNREVIRALALCGAPGVSEAVIPELASSDNPYVRAYMAQVLGQLFAEWPPPTSRWLMGSDFTMKNAMKAPYRALANEFFTNYLVPSFEEPWY